MNEMTENQSLFLKREWAFLFVGIMNELKGRENMSIRKSDQEPPDCAVPSLLSTQFNKLGIQI
jgi:hypothetical protein